MTENYTSWPLGQVPKEYQRPEIDILKERYGISDPREANTLFEEKICKFTGSRFAVLVDSCSNGLFLSMKISGCEGKITIPARTYISVPQQIIHAGCKPVFEDIEWEGVYQLKPYRIYDAAVRWTKGMYIPNTLMVVSFQIKKRLPIGKGGVILTDCEDQYNLLKKLVHDGRDIDAPYTKDPFNTLGYHMYMTPEDAARGLLIMDSLQTVNDDTGNHTTYTDLSKLEIFKND